MQSHPCGYLSHTQAMAGKYNIVSVSQFFLINFSFTITKQQSSCLHRRQFLQISDIVLSRDYLLHLNKYSEPRDWRRRVSKGINIPGIPVSQILWWYRSEFFIGLSHCLLLIIYFIWPGQLQNSPLTTFLRFSNFQYQIVIPYRCWAKHFILTPITVTFLLKFRQHGNYRNKIRASSVPSHRRTWTPDFSYWCSEISHRLYALK